MPRTKGATNKPKPDSELIKILKERGYSVVQGAENVKKAIMDVAEPKPKTKSKLVIEKPKIGIPLETPSDDRLTGQAIRCGNPACGKLLDGEVPTCPFCGVNLTWQ